MQDFLEQHKKSLEHFGFWDEMLKDNLKHLILSTCNTAIIRDYMIVDFVVNNDKVLLKWAKRFKPLTENELKDKFGRDYESTTDQ